MEEIFLEFFFTNENFRIHSGEKTHQCPWCPYRSVRKDNLKSHLKTHEKHALEARR